MGYLSTDIGEHAVPVCFGTDALRYFTGKNILLSPHGFIKRSDEA